MTPIYVIGGGVAGIGAAIELADRGYKVVLIEKSTLGCGASGRNPGRMGHGFHYIDPNTAKMYLRASVQVQRKYPGYLIAEDKEYSHPLRHGRYLITKNSDHKPEEILKTYYEIKKEYERLVEEDPENEVFGPVSDFFKVLEPSEYEDVVNPDIVEMGVETAEHLFNFERFLNDTRKIISKQKNIRLIEHAEVVDIDHGEPGEPRFNIKVQINNDEEKESQESSETYQTDNIVNATWQNIEKLNDKLGLRMIPGARTNRLKCLLVVKLPKELEKANSMFFCMGQHCMYSNMGNGYGMMTFAKITNLETSTTLGLSETAERFLNNEATQQEKNEITQQMLDGVAEYIPLMSKAKIVDVKFGIVQTAGKLALQDLNDPSNSFHKRDYDGIKEEQIGLISNPCMKLFYFLRNGTKVADLVEAQMDASLIAKNIIETIDLKAQANALPLSVDIKKALRCNLERLTATDELTKLDEKGREALSNRFFKTIEHKRAVNKKLNQKDDGYDNDIKPNKNC